MVVGKPDVLVDAIQREAMSRYNRLFTSFLRSASNDALKRMRQTVRSWRIHRRTPATLDDLAQQCNPTIQGWWNYYGVFYRTAMQAIFQYVDRKLERWARRKYKTPEDFKLVVASTHKIQAASCW